MLAGSLGLLPSASLGDGPPRPLRADPRLGAGHRRPGHRQSLRRDPQRRPAAAALAASWRPRPRWLEAAVDQAFARRACAPRTWPRPARRRAPRRPGPRCSATCSGADRGALEHAARALQARAPGPRAGPPAPRCRPTGAAARRSARRAPAPPDPSPRASWWPDGPPGSPRLPRTRRARSTPVPRRSARTASWPPASSSVMTAPKPFCWRLASSCPGCAGSPGYHTFCTASHSLSHSASAWALRPWCSRRACSVRMPRRVRKLSKGAPVSPRQLAHQVSCSCSAGSRAITAPPTTSRVAVQVLGGRVHHEVRAQGRAAAARPARGRCCRPP